MTICDGCGTVVDAEHIRQRIERLEFATRFRPVHIHSLLIGSAPPERMDQYFYFSERKAADFQRTGFFLVYASECPLPEGSDAREAVRRSVPTVLKRVNLSYKPQSIVLFSPATAELIAPLQAAGLANRLLLHNGSPYPALLDAVGERLTLSLSGKS